MTITATAKEIRALLSLAELDAQAETEATDLGEQEERRRTALKRTPRALRDRYETLRGTGRRPVIVAVERAVCSGCHIRLPTMLDQQARRALAVLSCPHCRRMLYLPDLLDPQPVAVVPEPEAPVAEPPKRRRRTAQTAVVRGAAASRRPEVA